MACCYAEEWKCKLEEMCLGLKKCKRDEMEQHEPGDAAGGQIISGLKVVVSVYDACKDSFVAADEQQEKASKKYFKDTGLMASVCRHGIPLFHVSLWTPGEQQFYAFALLSMLLEHLPNSWKVGCLYDIGCQIHCAVHKWDFASEWREHLSWGVSIFHTYGHQWACQLWYHPHKDALLGLSDGEGCERFWSELHHLISGLCVTGYHRHLFVLDMQLKHITSKEHFQLPRWLKEHLQHGESRLNSATEELGSQSIEELLSHFDSQHQHHSAPPGHQSKSAVRSLIELVMSLKVTHEMKEGILKEIIQGQDDLIGVDSVANFAWAELQEHVNTLSMAIEWLTKQIDKECANLNANDSSHCELQKAEKDKWAIGFTNLHVLKDQLHCKLQARKAELGRLDHWHGQREVDQSLHSQIEKVVKKRSTGIDSTLQKYNEKLRSLVSLQGKGGIPLDKWLPPELKKDGLYSLDVDQDIWQDYDLSDFEELPKWIIDPTVKDGIPLAQSIWSCCSEKKRCIAEQWNLYQWIYSEIHVTNTLYTTSLPKDMDVAFHASLKLHELAVLLKMCRTTLMSPGITMDQLQWPDFMPPAHINDFPFLKEVKDHVQSGLEPECASGGRPNAIQYFSRCQ